MKEKFKCIPEVLFSCKVEIHQKRMSSKYSSRKNCFMQSLLIFLNETYIMFIRKANIKLLHW